jgi:phospholipase C
MTGQNIGDVLNAKGVTWGWFQGGFTPDAAWDGNAADKVACTSTHNTIGGTTTKDYSAHHDPFQYYRSTANPHHLPGTPGVAIGAPDDQHQNSDGTWTGANHQYDLDVFEQAVTDDALPAVSYVKADAYQDGHPSNSDPIDEGHFYTRVINALEKSPEWRSTAVVIAYDDSDGWYDHVAPQIGNHSNTTDDAAVCTDSADAPAGGIEDRCGPSQRLPFLVISPYARANYIDHTKTGQASVVKFIEQNWELPVSNGSAIDDAAVSGSFDKTDGSIAGMFDFRAKPRTTPLILAQDGTVLSGGRTVTPVKPAPGKPAPPAANAQLAHAQAKLARDQKALAHAKKVAKRAHGAKKLAAQKKVAKLKRKVAQDKRAVKAAG